MFKREREREREIEIETDRQTDRQISLLINKSTKEIFNNKIQYDRIIIMF